MKMKRTVNWLSQILVLATIVAGTVLAAANGAEAGTTYGHPSISYSGAGKPPTSDKPQSKLWWNDGSWWADMWTTGSGWHIYRLDRSSETWVDTGVLIDSRTNTLADTLWDGSHLYIASHVVTVSNENTPLPSIPGQYAYLYRYSYSGGQYTLDSGFPTLIATNSSESMTIAQDTTGAIWATWTQVAGDPVAGFTNTVYVNYSAPGGTGWATPYIIPVSNPNPAADDISAIVAYGEKKIGVMWSDQRTGSVWWATRTDGTAPTATSSWKVQAATKGTGLADDHLNLKSLQADSAGRVFAAVKTNLDVASTDPTLEQLVLLVFKPGTGSFSKSTISVTGDCITRPQIVLDPENNLIHAFQTGPSSTVSGCPFDGVAGSIYEKTASMDNPVFGAGRGTPVMEDPASPNINDVTTSKQPVTSKTGLVVMASDDVAKRYWFADSVVATTYPVGGAIGAKYQSMGGVSSPLGQATSYERSTTGGAEQDFQFGHIFWSPVGGAHPLWGAIAVKWYPGHAAGWPIGDEEPLGGGAIAQHFTNGTMYYTPQIGLHYIGAGIRNAWWNKGGQTGAAGYPISDESSWYPGGAVQTFQGGTFYFTPQYGTKLLQGAIRWQYETNGGYSFMGRPVTDEYAADATTRAQRFEAGIIYWSNGRIWTARN